MKYILDTHVFLWSIANTKELSKNVIKVIKNPDNEIYISSVTLWEIAIKTRIGKLDITGTSIDEIPSIIGKLDYSQISMTAEDALGYINLKEDTHKDPFDRMLIWQCMSRNMIMISKDTEFSKFVQFGLKLFW
ncbi:MAG: type II toxin-antitoxin system VapC family toxin [Spirochaetia bacterium]|jgi:PIN domain nuclease of toxin-antitoxin system|nr:type II toxin-antitoxin system VapC family toxin [Spirochaetia bacterium]